MNYNKLFKIIIFNIFKFVGKILNLLTRANNYLLKELEKWKNK